MSLAVAVPVASANSKAPSPRTVSQSIPTTPRRHSSRLGQSLSADVAPTVVDKQEKTQPSEEKLSENLKSGSTSSSFSNNTLNVLFSAPLAGFDRTGKAHPLETLDYSSERDTLIQVFKEVHRDISVHFDFATTDSLRTLLSFGCKVLHFSGHGVPKGLCFEDGRSGLQVIRESQLKDLLSAGGLSLEFVFVSACYSKEIGEAFVKAGVNHVVCVKIDSKVGSPLFPFKIELVTSFLSFRCLDHPLDSRCSCGGLHSSFLCCFSLRENCESLFFNR
jgi:hypothetical protein